MPPKHKAHLHHYSIYLDCKEPSDCFVLKCFVLKCVTNATEDAAILKQLSNAHFKKYSGHS